VLEKYYVRPHAADCTRASWIGSEIECYVVWLAEHIYSRASVRCRVPVLFAFGEFAWAGGARSVGELPAHVEAFVAEPRKPSPALLLLATYGLRSREIAALTLDHIDCRRERLSVSGRKGGHSTAFCINSVSVWPIRIAGPTELHRVRACPVHRLINGARSSYSRSKAGSSNGVASTA
jgi:integrase